MARIKLISGRAIPTVRNFKSELHKYLTYANSIAIIILLVHILTD